MAVSRLVLRVRSIEHALVFYENALQGRVTERRSTTCDVDFDTSILQLRESRGATSNEWREDDATIGFRHVGFKVPSVDDSLDRMRAVGFRPRLGPVDIRHAGVRAAFLSDCDGVNVELVQGQLRYELTFDQIVAQEKQRIPAPTRPRFDHLAVTVTSFAAAADAVRRVGYRLTGQITHPEDRFVIHYFRARNTVIETFTFPEPPATGATPAAPAAGFLGVGLDTGTSATDGAVFAAALSIDVIAAH